MADRDTTTLAVAVTAGLAVWVVGAVGVLYLIGWL